LLTLGAVIVLGVVIKEPELRTRRRTKTKTDKKDPALAV
jgi:hypothetical protein